MSDEQIRESFPSPGDRGEAGPPPPRDDEYAPRYLRDADDDYPPVRRFPYSRLRQDKQHLRVLSIFYYVAAGLLGVFGLLPGIYLVVGIMMVIGSMGTGPGGPPPGMGYLFIGISSLFILLLEGTAVCAVVAGRSLVRQKRYVFCFVIAIIMCATALMGLQFVPLVVLGVFTIVVLARESVKELFRHGEVVFSTDEDYA